MKRLLSVLVGLEIFLLGGGQGWCADFQKGHAAYRSGDYATALREWKPLAENKGVFSLFYSKEDVINAQYNLGGMYRNGRGVKLDNVYAHMWGHIAAFNGNESGRELRDIVAKRMTSADITVARKLARECVRKRYKGC